LLGRIDKQADDIKALQSSNAELKSSNAELKSSNAELKSSNTSLKSRMDDKDNEIEGLNAKIDGLEEQAKTLSRDLQNEKSGRQDDMNALREVRRSTVIFTFSLWSNLRAYEGYPSSSPSPSPRASRSHSAEDPSRIPMQVMGGSSLRSHSPSAGGHH
jgi:FtsZ-binding cell division protein ZapB